MRESSLTGDIMPELIHDGKGPKKGDPDVQTVDMEEDGRLAEYGAVFVLCSSTLCDGSSLLRPGYSARHLSIL